MTMLEVLTTNSDEDAECDTDDVEQRQASTDMMTRHVLATSNLMLSHLRTSKGKTPSRQVRVQNERMRAYVGFE